MLNDAILNALQAVLQDAYTTAGSNVVVFATWQDPATNLPAYLQLYEATEADAIIGSGLRGTPQGPTWAYEPDVVLALYRQRAASQSGLTLAAAQQKMRADKAVLGNCFRSALPGDTHNAYTLDGTVLLAGKRVRFAHPPTGPFEQDAKGMYIARFTWRAAIEIVTKPRGNAG